jgi:hypothetical protein
MRRPTLPDLFPGDANQLLGGGIVVSHLQAALSFDWITDYKYHLSIAEDRDVGVPYTVVAMMKTAKPDVFSNYSDFKLFTDTKLIARYGTELISRFRDIPPENALNCYAVLVEHFLVGSDPLTGVLYIGPAGPCVREVTQLEALERVTLELNRHYMQKNKTDSPPNLRSLDRAPVVVDYCKTNMLRIGAEERMLKVLRG